MERRGFLGLILAAGVSPAIVRLPSLMRLRTLPVYNCGVPYLLYPSKFTREALLILEQNLIFSNTINSSYSKQFSKIGSTLTIRRPVRFLGSAAVRC